MKTIEETSQWVIDNRYPKSENDKVSDAEMYQTLIEAMNQVLRQPLVSGSLPSLDHATKVAVRISEEAITPPLDAKEQAIFIAGFQECIKWLNVVLSLTTNPPH